MTASIEPGNQGKTIVFAGGGTGGHIYPALAVAQSLRHDFDCKTEFLFIGSSRANEREMVEREEIPFIGVNAGALRGKNPIQVARGLMSLALGTREARKQLMGRGIGVVFATGGYASVPVGLASASLGIPLIVYLPDVHPGWAVRFLSRMARVIAASTTDSLSRLPKAKSVVTGYPVRREFGTTSREAARKELGLSDELPVVLVFGGSLGARRINRAVYPHLEAILSYAQVLHVTGPSDHSEAVEHAQQLPTTLRGRYHDFAYLHDLPAAMLASDLAVTRAGASVLGELPAASLPAIVVPLDLSDQMLNARYLERSKAAVIVTHQRLDRLPGEIASLLEQRDRLAEMKAAMASIARPDAAKNLAQLVLDQIN